MKKAYFYGNEVSEYGVKYGLVDYRCFAKAFDAVMANDLMARTTDIGWWEPITSDEYHMDFAGNDYTPDEALERIEELREERDALQEKLDALEELDDDMNEQYIADLEKKIDEIDKDIDCLEDVHYYDVFQWYIVDYSALPLLEEAHQIVFYNEELDIYLWGVTHCGTSWDYVLTCIPCHIHED